MTNTYFNPGCAISMYKPDYENRILQFLNEHYGETLLHKTCCRHEPKLPQGSVIINVCAGCDRRFRNLYEGISTVSLWEVLNACDAFSYPDYQGMTLCVHDPCPVRERPAVHKAVRSLLHKMRITVAETAYHGSRSICCGDDFYPSLPVEQVHALMQKRAATMPTQDVCVYCVSCIKSMHIGGRTPRHLLDLLMGEPTDPQVYDTVEWHEQLQAYIDLH